MSRLLKPSSTTSNCPWKGIASYFHVEVGGKVNEDAPADSSTKRGSRSSSKVKPSEPRDNVVRFGICRTLEGTFPQRNYFGDQIGVIPGIEYECLASAAWIDDTTLNMEILITDIHLGGLRISFAFKGDEISVFMTKQAEFFMDEYSGFAGGVRT